ncbi:AsmA family protein [Rhizosaccharibacter radicis]|uniref:AsmA family protein n=1 Tax=Rhizosaccharibacter radicis TaxID=2782605 RepID=A0ABT1VYM9_9PROT|nr:AsmA family protein [Acetobacteraceae bacterium KSS12]
MKRDAATGRRGGGLVRLVRLLAVLLGILVLAGAGIQSQLNQDAIRRRIEMAAARQTGRALAIDGFALRLLPTPQISARAVRFADMPAGARPDMLTTGPVTLHLSLLPLLRHVVRFDVVRASDAALLLERVADGRANWRMQPPSPPPGNGSAVTHPHERWKIELGSLHLEDARVEWHDRHPGIGVRPLDGAVSGLSVDADGLDGNHPRATGAGRHDTAGFAFTASSGDIGFLFAPDTRDRQPWPLRVAVTERLGGRVAAQATADATLQRIGAGIAATGRIDLRAADIRDLSALFPHAVLPEAHDATLAASGSLDAAGRWALTSLAASARTVRAPAGEAGWPRALVLDAIDIRAPRPDAPLAVAATGRWRTAGEHGRTPVERPVHLSGRAGTLAALPGWLSPPGGPRGDHGGDDLPDVPVALDGGYGDASMYAGGRVGHRRLSLDIDATVPSLATLVPHAPSLHRAHLVARLDAENGELFRVSAMKLTSREATLAGEVSFQRGARPSFTVALAGERIDLDGLLAGVPSASGQAKPDEVPGPASRPSPSPTPAANGSGTAAEASDGGKLPFAALDLADLDVTLRSALLRLGGADYHDLDARLLLKKGVLRIAPLRAVGPYGALDASLDADAGRTSLGIAMHPLMLPTDTVAHLLGMTPSLHGVVELVGALAGQGATRDALLRALQGDLGLSMVDGTIDDSLLRQFAGRSFGGDGGGQTALRCLALVTGTADGRIHLRQGLLQSRRVTLSGHGTIELPDGALDLHLLPTVAIGSAGAAMPVRVGGTLEAPTASLDPAAPGGRFALTIGPRAPLADPCGPALAAARSNLPGPGPGADMPAPKARQRPLDILRNLGILR